LVDAGIGNKQSSGAGGGEARGKGTDAACVAVGSRDRPAAVVHSSVVIWQTPLAIAAD
jgi:hypothetical protein